MRAVFLVFLLLAVFGATSEAFGHFFTSAGESAKDVVNRHLDLLKKVMQDKDRRNMLPKLIYLEPLDYPENENAYYISLQYYSMFLLDSTVKNAAFKKPGNITVVLQNGEFSSPDHTFEVILAGTSNDQMGQFVIPRAVRKGTIRRRVIRSDEKKAGDYQWCIVYGICWTVNNG